MAFIGSAIPRPVAGDKAKARHITDLHDTLTGASGFGQPMVFTDLDSSTYAALSVRQRNANGPIFYVWDTNESTGKILDVQRTQIVMNQPINATGIGSKATGFNAIGASGTFNGAAQTYRGLYLALTNTSSDAASSAIEEFFVGGVSKWKVNMAGKLVTGEINASLITGTINAATATNATNADTVDSAHAGNAANNVLKLDAGGLVPTANLPSMTGYVLGSGSNYKLQGGGATGDWTEESITINFPTHFTSTPTIYGVHVDGGGSVSGLAVIQTLSTTQLIFKVAHYLTDAHFTRYSWFAVGPV